MQLLTTFLQLSFIFKAVSSQICHETVIELDNLKFNVNHLKDHRPPSQSFSDISNIYASSTSRKNYTFFNLGDVVKKQKVDGHSIEDGCQPRSQGPSTTSNRPAACAPESNEKLCDKKKPCWIALGSCDKMTASFIDESNKEKGINLLYQKGDYQGSNFLVKINCCTTSACLAKKGLDSPAVLLTSGCPKEAAACVEISSPFGCDCDQREQLDKKLGKKEFRCDATPSGLSSSTSTGTLLLIFFFITVGLYLIVGMGYNYKEGRRGEEMIPHLDMWKDLGGLIYDGFMYVKSCGEYREGVQYDTIG